LKLLRPDLMSSSEMTLRFEQEARAASAIGHPHIVEVTDLGQSPEGFLFLVMEMLTGRTLADVLDEGRVRPPRAIDIICQILDGLEAAHAQKVVHRDLKPENVFLCSRFDREDFVKILDFGIARCFDDPNAVRLTQTGLVMGTPHYMAPEQARGKEADHRVDVYAAGVMLYEMVTGEQPFVGTNYNAVMMEVIKGEYPRPREIAPEVPAALEAVILRAMALEAPRRYQDAAAFRRDLEAQAEEVPVEPVQAAPEHEPHPRARGGRGWPSDTRETTLPRADAVSTTVVATPAAAPRRAPEWEFPSDRPLEAVPWDADEVKARPGAPGAEVPLRPSFGADDASLPVPVEEVKVDDRPPELWPERPRERPRADAARPPSSMRGPTTAGVWKPPPRRIEWRRHLGWIITVVVIAALWHPAMRLYRGWFAPDAPVAPGAADAGATIPVVLEVKPAEAEVFLDGHRVRKFPLAVPRDGRSRRLRFVATGFMPQEVGFVATEPQRFTIDLHHVPGPKKK
ncbi:MAG: serine/threonine protein kinase, partial [Deltaproteobacteria bacterium]|nr:serine/threonine protein kinase [Deltaproteobacteria bacterium]